MGFSSIDDWISEVTTNSKFFRIDWNKQTGGSAYTAGRWYDMTLLAGTPVANSWGEFIKNRDFLGSEWGWTLGAGWAWATDTITKNADGTGTLTYTEGWAPTASRTYRVTFTTSGISGGSITMSLGGTNGTARSTNGTFTENITTSTTGVLTFTPSVTGVRVTIDNVSVTEILAATPYTDNSIGAVYHGGNVSSDTKHILNSAVFSATATFVPGVWMLCDFLMCYPFIDMNSASTQTLINNNTLPRYTNGAGVRALLVPRTVIGATAHNLSMSYTNTVPTSGRQLPVTVACTASAIIGHITHSGVAANNYGPFLPLAAGDLGVSSVQTIKLSAASATANTFADLVLCRPLLTLPNTTASVATERDLMNQLPSLPRVYDGAYLGWLFFAGAAVAANSNAYGSIDVCWG